MREMLLSIFEDIVGFFSMYVLTGVKWASLIVGCVVVCGALRWIFRNEEVSGAIAKKLSFIFLIILYLYIIVGITILSRRDSITRAISFELFRTFCNTFSARKQIYENIIMFLPFTMLLYPLAKPFRKWWSVLLMGVGVSLAIETTQWITMTGHFELDDILTNTIGMMIGFAVCVTGEKIINWIRRR